MHKAVREGNRVSADILNIGAGEARAVVVRLEDASGKRLGETRLERLKSARDFVPGRESVTFILPEGAAGFLRFVADPEGRIEEIVEENNSAGLEIKPGTKEIR